MNKKKYIFIFTLLLFSSTFGQREYIRWNIFDINKVRTKFSNANQLCDGNFQNTIFALPPAFEYPSGSGINYGTDVAFIVGGYQKDAGGENPNNYPCVEAAMTEGPADYWDPNHYDPYVEFVNGDRACMNDDKDSWPINGFPNALPNYYYKTTYDYVNGIRTIAPQLETIPLLVDSTGWPGASEDGTRLAEQESFSVSYAIDHLAEVAPERWLTLQTITRGMAWSGRYYEDFIVWTFIGRNIGETPITDTYFAVWSDYSFISSFNPPNTFGDDGDVCFYDKNRQFAYSWDIDGFETSPTGGTMNTQDIAWAGTVVLKTPKDDNNNEIGVSGYDPISNFNAQTTNIGNGARKNEFYKYNLVNADDPRDKDGDGICETFDDGLDYFQADSEPTQILSSGPFTLEPGELDTMIIATVFGVSKLDLLKNVDQVTQLYRDKWAILQPPPMPKVTIRATDRKIELTWDREAEKDSLFEGYRIYKSYDGGVTWGTPITDIYGDVISFKPLEIFDLKNGITGVNPLVPGFSLGQDSGLDELWKEVDGDTVNYFVDTKVNNGYNYRYAVCAYTRGSKIKPPLENSISSNPSIPNDNTVVAIPNASVSNNSLGNIKVVPNPYKITAGWESQLGVKRIDFTNLPESCFIHIYNVAGEKIKTLNHFNGESTKSWNLLSESEQEVAPGLYFYYIEGKIGKTHGKFVLIL
ncbi:MAG: T9SS C-terminal target domain-containing protein [Bacteroidetes bacterium]|nr:T9SS C-terminal target domain-containing protein [Bacteroidota bacterium]MBU1117062.1 T9SS C-terminal target domain-containing protein [Bacteroidota bacterium]MBU1797657.1 T9SS C-terminal target domain-containing protein [Bacteroidota bacterium]